MSRPRRTLGVRTAESFIEHLETRQLMAADLVAIPGSPDAASPGVVVATGNAARFGNVAGKHQELKALVGGTQVVFKLDGPGVGRVRYVGGRYVVNLTNTTDRTNVSIKAQGHKGASEPVISAINVPGSLHDVRVDGVTLASRFQINGTVHKLDLADVQGVMLKVLGTGGKAYDVKMDNVSGGLLWSGSPLHDLRVKAWDHGGQVEAPFAHNIRSDGNLSAAIVIAGKDAHGDSLHDVRVKGAITAGLAGPGNAHNIQAGSVSSSRILFAGTTHDIHIKGPVSGSTIASRTIHTVEIKGDVTGSHVAAGLGFGGRTAGQIFAGRSVTWRNGSIESIKIDGDVTRSTFTVGVRPIDGIWGNGNDRFASGVTDGIGKIDIKGSLLDAVFEARKLPKALKTGHNQTAVNVVYLTAL